MNYTARMLSINSNPQELEKIVTEFDSALSLNRLFQLREEEHRASCHITGFLMNFLNLYLEGYKGSALSLLIDDLYEKTEFHTEIERKCFIISACAIEHITKGIPHECLEKVLSSLIQPELRTDVLCMAAARTDIRRERRERENHE